MRIIPAIDIIDGKCVRLSKGDYNTKIIYNENPLEVAKEFEAHGIEYLHLVDLDGAKSSKIVNYKILEQIASQTKLKIDFGGGLKADSDLKIAFESGANQITGGSIAVKNRAIFEKWIAEYGSDKIILSEPYSAIHFSKIALFFTAILPPVIWLAPDSKAIFKSESAFKPPPKSIFNLVCEAICSNIL